MQALEARLAEMPLPVRAVVREAFAAIHAHDSVCEDDLTAWANELGCRDALFFEWMPRLLAKDAAGRIIFERSVDLETGSMRYVSPVINRHKRQQQHTATPAPRVNPHNVGCGEQLIYTVRDPDYRVPDGGIALPNRGGESEGAYTVLTTRYVERLVAQYSAVDDFYVGDELERMRLWLEDNPARRPLALNMERFVNQWLARKADDTIRWYNDANTDHASADALTHEHDEDVPL